MVVDSVVYLRNNVLGNWYEKRNTHKFDIEKKPFLLHYLFCKDQVDIKQFLYTEIF